MNRIVIVTTAVVGASLYLVYFFFGLLFLQHIDWTTLTALEAVIIVTQAMRVGGIGAYYRSRPPRIEVVLVLLSFETFVVMGLIVKYILTPIPIYSNLADTIFSTWIASLFLVLPSYLNFAAVVQMTQNRRLVALLLSLTLEFGFLAFVASTMITYSGTFTFANFFELMVNAARSDFAAGRIAGLSDLAILLPTAAVYCSLLVYTTLPTITSSVPPRVAFVLPLFAAAAALAWVYAAVLFIPNSLLSFTIPGIIVAVLLWIYMRR